MKLKEKNNIYWFAFPIAFIFLFNPNVAVIDPLPDIFGYIILSVLLTRLAMINEALYDAKRAFERLVIIDAGKLVSVLWIFGIDAISERNMSLLLWSFIFGVLEIMFAISAFVKLFNGMTSLGNFHTNTSVLGKRRERSKSYTDFLRNFSVAFIIVKAVLTCLPELSVLGANAYDETTRFTELYRYIGVMRAFCMIPVIFIGLVWLITAIRYFFRVGRDKPFVNEIKANYSSIRVNKSGVFVIKDVKIATLFFVLASILTIDFEFDGVNVIPDFLVLIAMGISLFYFSKATKLKKGLPIAMLTVYGVATLFEDFIRYYFSSNFYYNAINKNGEAFAVYIVTVIAVAVEGITLFLLYLAMSRAIRQVVVEHTGYVLGKEIKTEGEQKQIEAVQKRLSKNFSFVSDVIVLCVLADTFASLYGAFYAFLNKNFGWMSLISIVCGFLLIGMTIKAVSELKEAVQTKYMLE